MIDVTEARKLEALPARSKRELFERLDTRIGRILKIDVAYREETYSHYAQSAHTLVGELLWLKKVEGRSVKLKLRGSGKFRLKLIDGVSVLADGGWVPIHIPLDQSDEDDEDDDEDDEGFRL